MIVQYGSDITKIETGIIAHGVNCQSRMESGIAKAIYTKWPVVKEHYLTSEQKLSNINLVTINTNRLAVANCFTQEYYGRDNKRYADSNAIALVLGQLFMLSDMLKLPLHVPMIGCGLGGLDWKVDVEPIVDMIHNLGCDVTVHELKEQV